MKSIPQRRPSLQAEGTGDRVRIFPRLDRTGADALHRHLRCRGLSI